MAKLHYTGPVDGPWVDLALINGFTAGSQVPQIMKDSRGRVFLRGRVVSPSGLVGVTAFAVVPAGYVTVLNTAYYVDWAAGGSAAGTEADPKTAVVAATWLGGALRCNYDGAGAADLTPGKVHDIRRASWPTT